MKKKLHRKVSKRHGSRTSKLLKLAPGSKSPAGPATLREQQTDGARLHAAIAANLKEFGYGG